MATKPTEQRKWPRTDATAFLRGLVLAESEVDLIRRNATRKSISEEERYPLGEIALPRTPHSLEDLRHRVLPDREEIELRGRQPASAPCAGSAKSKFYSAKK